MNIYLIAYVRNNLGDDLFLSMLISKYPNINFDINVRKIEYAESLKRFKNVNILKNKKINIKKYGAIVYVGGSIFMEQNFGKVKMKLFNKFIKHAKQNKIPFYYISSNFGPYRTKEYLDIARDTFKNCEDVCFRDKYSYNLFKDIKSVRYAPDLIFDYDLREHSVKKDTIGISVINLSNRKDLKDKENQYLRMLTTNINYYLELGKEIYLFSFCKYQGDEDAIAKIKSLVKYKEKLNIVEYNGNINEFLDVYSQMEYMICTRFHSMILSAKLNQKILVISYSPKIDNVIQDLELPFNNILIKDIKETTILNLSNFKNVEKIYLKSKTINAKKQLQKLDDFINTEEEM